jgi:hypothetical protein
MLCIAVPRAGEERPSNLFEAGNGVAISAEAVALISNLRGVPAEWK